MDVGIEIKILNLTGMGMMMRMVIEIINGGKILRNSNPLPFKHPWLSKIIIIIIIIIMITMHSPSGVSARCELLIGRVATLKPLIIFGYPMGETVHKCLFFSYLVLI